MGKGGKGKQATTSDGLTPEWKGCSIARKYPTYRSTAAVSVSNWFAGKRKDDEAEGFWRIHDTLYDFTNFVDRHPGGDFWLKQTKGCDITESFESHHVTTLPESMLKKFEVRKAAKPRNYTITMHENGFYKTLKRRVRVKLESLNYTGASSKASDFSHTALLLAMFALAIASARTGSVILEVLSGLAMAWLVTASHNYFHKKDNWRMYAWNFSLFNCTSWRSSHALSHHCYANTMYDMELVMFEPFLCWTPNIQAASTVHRIISVIAQPFLWIIVFPLDFIRRSAFTIMKIDRMYWHDLVGFTLPLAMWIASDLSIFAAFREWFVILLIGSFIFSFVGITAAHHAPTIYHEGDAKREDRDWGIFQMDTIIDRKDLKGSDFLVLTHFGEHVLHHLFPTVDHAVLPLLQPELMETINEFKLELRECNHLEHIIGESKQLLRSKANPHPPGSAQNK